MTGLVQLSADVDAMIRLFTPEQSWIQTIMAMDSEKRAVGSANPGATCWCLLGGATKVTESRDSVMDPSQSPMNWKNPRYVALIKVIANEIRGNSDAMFDHEDDSERVWGWNDAYARTYAQVMNLLRAVQERLKQPAS